MNKKNFYNGGLILITLTIIISLFFTSCNEVSLLDRAFPERINVNNLPYCDLENPNHDVCIIFHDSFERDNLKAGDFNWSKFIMDGGGSGTNVDAAIYDKNFLGPIKDGTRALLFTGRDGSSVHEIYLISQPLNLKHYNKIQIQFDYVPLSLEKEIVFKNWKKIPESIRVEICNASDKECGIIPVNSTNLKSNKWINPIENWINTFDFQFGKELTLAGKGNNHQVPYTIHDWIEVNISYDLNNNIRKNEFVFRISVALDEGFIKNNPNNDLEDGIIFDNIYIIAFK